MPAAHRAYNHVSPASSGSRYWVAPLRSTTSSQHDLHRIPLREQHDDSASLGLLCPRFAGCAAAGRCLGRSGLADSRVAAEESADADPALLPAGDHLHPDPRRHQDPQGTLLHHRDLSADVDRLHRRSRTGSRIPGPWCGHDLEARSGNALPGLRDADHILRGAPLPWRLVDRRFGGHRGPLRQHLGRASPLRS